jgi:hypothetical protein
MMRSRGVEKNKTTMPPMQVGSNGHHAAAHHVGWEDATSRDDSATRNNNVLSAVKVEPSGLGPIRQLVCQVGGGRSGAGQDRTGRSACCLFLLPVSCHGDRVDVDRARRSFKINPTRIPGAWVFSGCTNSVLRTCIQLSGLIQGTGTEYGCTTCLVPSFFQFTFVHFPPSLSPVPQPLQPTFRQAAVKGVQTENSTRIRYQIGWRGCRHRTPRLVRGLLWRVCLEDFPLARSQGERGGGGTGAVGTVGLGPRWVERDQDQAVGNLMVTCSTSLPRSDITVGSVSFGVGFLF